MNLKPDDTEINQLIHEEAESLEDALFEIANKYHAGVTNNEPRWVVYDEYTWLRPVGDFIADVKKAVDRWKGTP